MPFFLAKAIGVDLQGWHHAVKLQGLSTVSGAKDAIAPGGTKQSGVTSVCGLRLVGSRHTWKKIFQGAVRLGNVPDQPLLKDCWI